MAPAAKSVDIAAAARRAQVVLFKGIFLTSLRSTVSIGVTVVAQSADGTFVAPYRLLHRSLWLLARVVSYLDLLTAVRRRGGLCSCVGARSFNESVGFMGAESAVLGGRHSRVFQDHDHRQRRSR